MSQAHTKPRRAPIILRRVVIEEARSEKPGAKWRPVKDGVVRLRYMRVWVETIR